MRGRLSWRERVGDANYVNDYDAPEYNRDDDLNEALRVLKRADEEREVEDDDDDGGDEPRV